MKVVKVEIVEIVEIAEIAEIVTVVEIVSFVSSLFPVPLVFVPPPPSRPSLFLASLSLFSWEKKLIAAIQRCPRNSDARAA